MAATISVDTVAALLASLGVNSVSKKSFDFLSAMDGTKTASSFEHQFRPIMAKARALKKRIDDEEQFIPVQPGNKRGPPATPSTPAKRKAGGATAAEETPTKKAKTPKKTPAKTPKKAPAKTPAKAPTTPDHESVTPSEADEEDNTSNGTMVKEEPNWESEFGYVNGNNFGFDYEAEV
ncbi:hypothetical protein IQ07DRAFT_685151 [Pyrenochaeta sp. DS3sAY3a]|nr:hypothetical protein IQ07DRAFT_685151 [Pyrenochaeta sp. DS3sAY3a]